ncbi:hypothetical protein BST81_00625 [Leptolyngbya sp. 'hensonii']|nr:hypothetical protein BST81_00625 [Leptolyngbya sp. 'hensonii']
MPSRSKPQRFAVPALLGYALIGFWSVSGAIATAVDWDRAQQLELTLQSRFQEIRNSITHPTPPNNLIILAMDDDSFVQAAEFYRSDPKTYASLGNIQVWPWKRAAYAEVIEKLMQAGARSVALDVILADPSDSPEDDRRLQEVLRRYAGRVVLAAQFTSSDTPAGMKQALVTPTDLFPNVPLTLGLINFQLAADQRLRHLPDQIQAEVLRDLGLEQPILPFYRSVLQISNLPQAEFHPGDFIFYYGPAGKTFRHVPFWEVLHPGNWQVHLKQQTFKDKVVLIGPTALDLQDFQLTPVGKMAGIEIHANAMATALENRALSQGIPDPLFRGLLVLIGALGAGIVLSTIPKRPAGNFLWAMGITIAWGTLSYFSFTYNRQIFPTVVPMLTIFLSGITSLTTGAISSQMEQRRLQRTLERYVAAPIVQQILLNYSNDFQSLLQGRKVKAAIMFCDIRGFTTLSYKLEPEQLINQLNDYFDAMVNVILAAGGTLDKFIGDAVMAEFGSPLSSGEHKDVMNAVQAALGMRYALCELRKQWQQEGKILFFNGIGINFGELLVGDIGSDKRREFAAIGDAVNVASRVESMTKNFETDILITDSVYELVRDEVEVQDVGKHALKGREEPVQLYILIGLKGKDQTLYKQVQEDLHMYLSQAKE